jgi:hypothetical protein
LYFFLLVGVVVVGSLLQSSHPLALDRSTSIFTDSTFIYREFLQRFVDSYTFDPTSPTTSTLMGIVQWGNVLNPTAPPFPIGNYGSIPFTMDSNNVKTAVSQIGCVGNPCNFCNGNPNNTYCISPGYVFDE